MGNVLAAADQGKVPTMTTKSAPVPPPPPITADDPEDKSKSSTSQGQKIREDELTNPGTFEDLHKKCKDIFPMNFEGARLVINKGLSNHFQVSHTVTMSNLAPTGYKFGATYVGTTQYSPSEAFPVLLAEMDPSGELNGSIMHQPFSYLKWKYVAQIQKGKFAATQISSDIKGKDYTASLTLGNPDIVGLSGVLVSHYLQQLTPKLSLGAEFMYQRNFQIPGGQAAIVSLAGRYLCDRWQLSGQLGSSGLHMCYYLKGNEQMQFGVELETNFRVGESVATFAYQVDLPKANLVFRGMVDSNFVVGGVLEKRLQPLPFTLALSGMINHSKNQGRFGIGCVVG